MLDTLPNIITATNHRLERLAGGTNFNPWVKDVVGVKYFFDSVKQLYSALAILHTQ